MRHLAGCPVDRLALLLHEGGLLRDLVGRGFEDAQLVMHVRHGGRDPQEGFERLFRGAGPALDGIHFPGGRDGSLLDAVDARGGMLVGANRVLVDCAEPSDAARQLANLLANRFRFRPERGELRLQGEEAIELIPELERGRDLGQEVGARRANPFDFRSRSADLTLDTLLGRAQSGGTVLHSLELRLEPVDAGERSLEDLHALVH